MSDWIPLLQTLVWPVFIFVLLLWFRSQLVDAIGALSENVRKGAPVAAGPSGLSIGSPPPEIERTSRPAVATAEGLAGAQASLQITTELEQDRLPPDIVESPYLVHEAQVIRARIPEAAGLYRVRVTLECWPSSELDQVQRVTYRLHPTFGTRTIATEARASNFELWLNVYGEFTIVAVVERVGQTPLWLTRYLNLPGRPPE